MLVVVVMMTVIVTVDRLMIVAVIVVVLVVMGMTVTVIVIVAVIVAVIVRMIVAMILPFNIDIKLGRADATPIDSPDPKCKPAQIQFRDLTFQQFEIETGANHCTNEHVTTDAGKTVEIKSPCHIPYSNEPAMMVVATSGCRYLCIASLTCALVTAFTIPGNLSR